MTCDRCGKPLGVCWNCAGRGFVSQNYTPLKSIFVGCPFCIKGKKCACEVRT